jgi:hypothetical protein
MRGYTMNLSLVNGYVRFQQLVQPGASTWGGPRLALWASAWPHGPYNQPKRCARQGSGGLMPIY